MTPQAKPEGCACCGYATDRLSFYEAPKYPGAGQEDHWYCDLCAGTLTSRVAMELSQRDAHSYHAAMVLKTICYVGNAVIDAIKGKR